MENGKVRNLTDSRPKVISRSDQPAAEAFVQADPSLKIAYVIVTNEAFGIAIPPGEGVLQGAVNTCLRMLRLSGRYDAIVTDWFG